jgi:hypothetical protein
MCILGTLEEQGHIVHCKVCTLTSHHAATCELKTANRRNLALNTSHLTPHTSLLTPHASLLTPYASLLTPHTSHLPPHTSLLTDDR